MNQSYIALLWLFPWFCTTNLYFSTTEVIIAVTCKFLVSWLLHSFRNSYSALDAVLFNILRYQAISYPFNLVFNSYIGLTSGCLLAMVVVVIKTSLTTSDARQSVLLKSSGQITCDPSPLSVAQLSHHCTITSIASHTCPYPPRACHSPLFLLPPSACFSIQLPKTTTPLLITFFLSLVKYHPYWRPLSIHGMTPRLLRQKATPSTFYWIYMLKILVQQILSSRRCGRSDRRMLFRKANSATLSSKRQHEFNILARSNLNKKLNKTVCYHLELGCRLRTGMRRTRLEFIWYGKPSPPAASAAVHSLPSTKCASLSLTGWDIGRRNSTVIAKLFGYPFFVVLLLTKWDVSM